MEILGILWHSTGANNPNLKRYVQPSDDSATRAEDLKKLGTNTSHNDWNHIKRNAGLNAWIGKFADGSVGTVQTMPWNYAPWGCGKGKKGSCNSGWIQFEICEDNLTDASYFNKVYEEACQLTAYLCSLHGLDPNGTAAIKGVKVPVITCHADAAALGFASNHADVNHWFAKYGKSMQTVREDVAKLLGKTSQTQTASQTASASQTSSTDNGKTIWDFILDKIGNEYGVAGLIGNLYAESGLRPNNLQNGFEKKLGMTDATYTAAVDNGTYGNFVKDSAGYGLAQWTYWSRKQNLLNYAKTLGKSIGDLSMQLSFLWQELQGYKGLLKTLSAAKSVYDASTAVLTVYEKPADQSDTVKKKRAEYGQTFYKLYARSSVSVTTSSNNVQQCSTSSEQKYTTGNYKVVAGAMRIRSGPGTHYTQKKFKEMSVSARQLNKQYENTGLAYYKKGTVFTAMQVSQNIDGSWWAKNPSGWICLADSETKYCQKV